MEVQSPRNEHAFHRNSPLLESAAPPTSSRSCVSSHGSELEERQEIVVQSLGDVRQPQSSRLSSVCYTQEQHNAATAIQAHYKGYRTRKTLTRYHTITTTTTTETYTVEESSRREKAATVIQAGYRGYSTRNTSQVHRQTTVVTEVQVESLEATSGLEVMQDEGSQAERDKHQAAVKIQSTYRGYRTRKAMDGNRKTRHFEEQCNKIAQLLKEDKITREDLPRMLERKAMVVDMRDSNGRTLLHLATIFENSGVVRYLGSHYPHILNTMDKKQLSPLHYAAVLRDGGYIYKILSTAAASDTQTDANGKSPSWYMTQPHTFPININKLKTDIRQTTDKFSLATWRTNQIDGEMGEEIVLSRPASLSDNDPIMTTVGHLSQPSSNMEEQSVISGISEFVNSKAKVGGRSMTNGRVRYENEYTEYLQNSIGQCLGKALAAIVDKRPQDPVHYLAMWLKETRLRKKQTRSQKLSSK